MCAVREVLNSKYTEFDSRRAELQRAQKSIQEARNAALVIASVHQDQALVVSHAASVCEEQLMKTAQQRRAADAIQQLVC